MGVVVDTSVMIAAEKRAVDLGMLFRELPKEEFYIAAITASELLHGVERADSEERRDRRALFVEDILGQLPVLAFDLPTARVHARFWAELQSSGRIIGPFDLQIAATALRWNHQVATLNGSEFSRVEGLALVDMTRCLV